MGSIPSQGASIPHAVGQLSPCASTREKPAHQQKIARASVKIPRATTKTLCSQKQKVNKMLPLKTQKERVRGGLRVVKQLAPDCTEVHIRAEHLPCWVCRPQIL